MTAAPDTVRAWGARQVSVRLGAVLALDAVSLEVPAGQVTAVVGGDGAGKSTLLRCLAGALAPSGGTVAAPGAARTGYLPASSGTYPDLTVAENLAFRAAAYGMPAGPARERAAELTERAGLAAARARLAGQLSGGMRQKLGVICALLHGPDLLVLDEPTTGVDPVSRAGLWRLIAGAAAGGAAVLVATTYLAEAERAAAVLVLDGGRTLAAGTPARIVAELPGTITAAAGPPAAAQRPRSWRRDGRWRTWTQPGTAAPPGPAEPVTPDLQDAVTVASLAHELASPDTPAAADTVSQPAGPGAGTGAGQAGGGGAVLAECRAVTRRFGQAVAVRGVSLEVRAGEIVGLLGANGAGKTTLIRMLLGLLPASGGTVALFGGPPDRGARRRLGYVPQGLGLYDDLTVAENLRFTAAVFGSPARNTGSTGSPGSPGDQGVPVGRLPLGLQRRAAFAQALAHQPDLLVLDEPTSGVDPLGRARLWETIRGAAEAGAGVLVTTHYLEEARECDRLVIMTDGAVAAAGTPDEVIGGATVTTVAAADWGAAFRRLEACGLAVSLAGHELRVPGASPAAVRAALGAGTGGPEDGVRTAPATLEERFFQLVQSPAGEGEHG